VSVYAEAAVHSPPAQVSVSGPGGLYGYQEIDCSSMEYQAGGRADHSATSAQITVEGSGFETNYGEGWQMGFVGGVYQYDVTLDSTTVTVGGTREVEVTVKKHGGAPAPGVTVDVTALNPQIIDVASETVVTDANGKAMIELIAHAPGYADILADARGGGQAQEEQAALEIKPRDVRPTAGVVETEIDALADPDFQVRANAMANLISWGQQYPDLIPLYEEYRNEPNQLAAIVHGLDAVLDALQVTGTVEGNQLSVDTSRVWLGQNEAIFSVTVSSSDGQRLQFKLPQFPRVWLLALEIDQEGCQVDAMGLLGPVVINFEVEILTQGGNTRVVTGSLPLKVVDQ
jgi:hypothetical protein